MRISFAVLSSLLLLLSGAALADTTMDRILSDLEAGQIDNVEAAQLLALSVTDYDQLESRYTDGVEAGYCGTPAIMEALRLVEEMDIVLANRPTLSGPEYTFNSPDGHFKIHWTDSGSDATNLAYATTIAVAADSSWQKQCNEMGFITPPPDMNVGGDMLYDIYVCYLSGGTLGYTSPSGEFHPPDSTQDCSASHIVMNSNIPSAGQRICTVAHEFQHAVQMSYDYHEKTWFMENCAVWMEEMVYPSINDYLPYIQYGENALRSPWMDIRSGAMYWYGAFTWPWMMWDRWGYESVRNVWEYCYVVNGENTEEAHIEMFDDKGTDWESYFMDYCCWRWFTATNWFSGCGMYNPEVTLWTPGPRVLPWHEITSIPATGDETMYGPAAYGNAWIRVDLSGLQGHSIRMYFDGLENFDWDLGVIMQDMGTAFTWNWYECDPTTGDYYIDVDATGWDYAIFVVGAVEDAPQDHTYNFGIVDVTGIEGSPDPTGTLNLQVSSNPIQSGDVVSFNMPSTGSAIIKVYDVSGRVTATLLDQEVQAGNHSVQFSDANLSEGTYFIMLFADDQIEGRKVVLSR